MTIRIAINGFGRIGRSILRALYERDEDDLRVVAFNDLAAPETLAHLFRHDSVHRTFTRAPVTASSNDLCIGEQTISVTRHQNLRELPWQHGVLYFTEEPLVSSDYIGHPGSCIFDATLTKLSGSRQAKVFAWYDNEWGFSQRMLDVSRWIAS